jgi:hypothetical protein
LNPYAFTPYCSGIFGTYTFGRKKYVEFIAIFVAAFLAIKNKYLNKLKAKANSIAKVVARSIGKASKMAKNAMQSKALQSTLSVVSASGILTAD